MLTMTKVNIIELTMTNMNALFVTQPFLYVWYALDPCGTKSFAFVALLPQMTLLAHKYIDGSSPVPVSTVV